jgi:hypothetical protein
VFKIFQAGRKLAIKESMTDDLRDSFKLQENQKAPIPAEDRLSE